MAARFFGATRFLGALLRTTLGRAALLRTWLGTPGGGHFALSGTGALLSLASLGCSGWLAALSSDASRSFAALSAGVFAPWTSSLLTRLLAGLTFLAGGGLAA